jgi:hypothetical protein
VCDWVCLPGWADCNHQAGDGCEIATDADFRNCGACGVTCASPANAASACDVGKCGFRCLVGWGDCNLDPKDGCETSVVADIGNCGHCGNACPVRPNARAAVCLKGQCGSQCQPGFGDCNGNPLDGCEADLLRDPADCGACGNACANGQSCVGGRCQ